MTSDDQQHDDARRQGAGASLLDQIMAQTGQAQGEAQAQTRRGAAAFIAELLAAGDGPGRVDQCAVDGMIAEIDRKLSRQLDAILHSPQVQKLEASWRALRLVVDRTDFRENTRILLLNVAKDALQADFEDAPEISQSGLYRIVYSSEYGQFGGEPYAAMIADYEFGPGPQDVALLQKVAAVATMAHAPFIAAAGPRFFGLDSFERLPALNDLAAAFAGPQYIKWRAFRESEDSRSVGLTCPRFLLRQPWGVEGVAVRAFDYAEDVSGGHTSYVWGNAAFAFATRLTDSFAKHRWCPNIVGPRSGGAVERLPTLRFQALGALESRIPTEVLVSERCEFALAEQGFIAFAPGEGEGSACFYSANSVQRPKTFAQTPEGRSAETNYRLGTQLPYMMIMNRMAHYLKVLQREQIGSWKEKVDLHRELNSWISQYVVDMDDASAEVRNARPLRTAEVTIEDAPGDGGWYKVGVKVRPHFKHMGASFTLSLVGKLDREA